MRKTKRPEVIEIAKKYCVQDERLKAIDGHGAFDMYALNMCLVQGLVIPHKFKVPYFHKYKGDIFPKHHLVMFFWITTSYTLDYKLIIHCFQDSLSGASLSWYMELERSHIQSWLNLANAFLKKYQYNLDKAPSRFQSKDLSQKSNESFKEYAQIWRELDARVQPPLLEKELVDIFVHTL